MWACSLWVKDLRRIAVSGEKANDTMTAHGQGLVQARAALPALGPLLPPLIARSYRQSSGALIAASNDLIASQGRLLVDARAIDCTDIRSAVDCCVLDSALHSLAPGGFCVPAPACMQLQKLKEAPATDFEGPAASPSSPPRNFASRFRCRVTAGVEDR